MRQQKLVQRHPATKQLQRNTQPVCKTRAAQQTGRFRPRSALHASLTYETGWRREKEPRYAGVWTQPGGADHTSP